MPETSNINRVSPEAGAPLVTDRLLIANRAWLTWLQGLFKSRPIGNYKWDRNVTETEIIITDQNPSGSEPSNKRPIIATSRGAATWASTSMNQTIHINLASPNRIISDIIGCSVTISVIAREGLEAQGLAYELFRMIPVFKTSIMKLGRIHAIGNNITLTPETQHGQIVQGSSVPEWKMIQLVIPFYIQDVISVEDEDFYTLIRAVNLHMGLS